jgi:hypothetical protein
MNGEEPVILVMTIIQGISKYILNSQVQSITNIKMKSSNSLNYQLLSNTLVLTLSKFFSTGVILFGKMDIINIIIFILDK